MSKRPNARNWNDIQTAIATVAVVTTLGLWNLFAQPAKTVTAQVQETETPPSTEEPPVSVAPTVMPQVKIMFTQTSPQTSITSQQPQQQTTAKKKKKNNNGGGGGTVTKTKTS